MFLRDNFVVVEPEELSAVNDHLEPLVVNEGPKSRHTLANWGQNYSSIKNKFSFGDVTKARCSCFLSTTILQTSIFKIQDYKFTVEGWCNQMALDDDDVFILKVVNTFL